MMKTSAFSMYSPVSLSGKNGRPNQAMQWTIGERKSGEDIFTDK
jgi:hypothetical protein